MLGPARCIRADGAGPGGAWLSSPAPPGRFQVTIPDPIRPTQRALTSLAVDSQGPPPHRLHAGGHVDRARFIELLPGAPKRAGRSAKSWTGGGSPAGLRRWILTRPTDPTWPGWTSMGRTTRRQVCSTACPRMTAGKSRRSTRWNMCVWATASASSRSGLFWPARGRAHMAYGDQRVLLRHRRGPGLGQNHHRRGPAGPLQRPGLNGQDQPAIAFWEPRPDFTGLVPEPSGTGALRRRVGPAWPVQPGCRRSLQARGSITPGAACPLLDAGQDDVDGGCVHLDQPPEFLDHGQHRVDFHGPASL